jgi:hypothetical protein
MAITARLMLLSPVLALAVGCGGGSSSDSPRPHGSVPAQQVRTTVQGWLDSLTVGSRHGDNVRACAYLTPGLRKSIDEQLRVRGERASCRTFAANWTGGSTPPGRPGAHITRVAVTDGSASVSLAAPPDRESEVRLQHVRGRWLIDNY